MSDNTKGLLRNTPIYILILPVLFIHIGYNELFGFLSVQIILKNFLGFTSGIFIIFFSSKLYLKDKRKSLIFSFILSVYILFFGYIQDTLKLSVFSDYLARYIVLIPATLLLFVFLAIWLKKKNKSYNKAYNYLNLLMIILICMECLKSVYYFGRLNEHHKLIDPRFSVYKEFKKYRDIADSLKPDIYLIIFDEMTSSYGLKKYLGKENDTLDQSLTNEGFFVIKKSISNYNQTVYSMSSMLNMEYIPENNKPMVENPVSLLSCVESISNNSMFSILKDQKYMIRHYQPFKRLDKDFTPVPFFKDIQEQHYFYKTLPGRIHRDLFWNIFKLNNSYILRKWNEHKWAQKKERKKNIHDLTILIKKSCSKTGNPKFVYGHYILPHSPYFFNQNGDVLQSNPKDPIKKNYNPRMAYYHQMLYSNKIIRDLTTYIKRNNRKNTIIMIMGDHGYRDNLRQLNISGSFYNLNAIYFPDHNYQSMHDSLSSVNLFRIVLNKYFNSKFPILKDSTVIIKKTTMLH